MKYISVGFDKDHSEKIRQFCNETVCNDCPFVSDLAGCCALTDINGNRPWEQWGEECED